VDQVRLYVQDVDESRKLLSDEEIEFVLEQWRASHNHPVWAASVCAEIIASKFVGEVNVSADGINVDQGSLQGKYNDLAASLRDQYHALLGVVAPAAGTMYDTVPDPTIPGLSFGVGFQDNARAGDQEYGGERGPGHSPEYGYEDAAGVPW
jgi:hypothetical protein